MATTIDGVAAQTLLLGSDAAPIDVTYAFGSIWTANHHRRSVSRINPETMTVEAEITVAPGPGWFVVTPDALWVSNQLHRGLTPIDPVTNVARDLVGDAPPCSRGFFAFGSVWQAGCDAGIVMRIDPATYDSTNISLEGRGEPILAGDRIIASGPGGLAWLDPETETWQEIGGGQPGMMWAFDGRTIWVSNERQVFRVRASDGKVVATLPIVGGGVVAFDGDRGWVTAWSTGVVEVDLETNEVVRTIGIRPSPLVAMHALHALWVTNYDVNTLIRLEP